MNDEQKLSPWLRLFVSFFLWSHVGPKIVVDQLPALPAATVDTK